MHSQQSAIINCHVTQFLSRISYETFLRWQCIWEVKMVPMPLGLREKCKWVFTISHAKIKGDDFFWHNDAGMCFRSGMRRFDGSWH